MTELRWEQRRLWMEVRYKPRARLEQILTVELTTVNMYITKPKGKTPRVAVLYLTDVFGIQLAQNKL